LDVNGIADPERDAETMIFRPDAAALRSDLATGREYELRPLPALSFDLSAVTLANQPVVMHTQDGM
jgi:hypothetical protein